MSNLIGKELLDRFRVEAFVASGGMSVVYRVWDQERSAPLAMKILHMDLAEDPSALKRFEREARALKKLAHPHIVSFYGLYQAEGMNFLLEQFVDGPTLKSVLRQSRGEPLPTQEALIYLKALSAALGYAHASGVVHCDVKPGNVMIDRGGNIFLTDFGVARHAESTTTTLGVAGTPAYMAPEQVRGDPVTAETDTYGLGVLLYEMLAGRRPFVGSEAGTESSGATAAERVRMAHLSLAVPDPRQFNPEIPDPLAQLILQALAKDPRERFSSVMTFFEAVCDALGVQPGGLPDHVAPPDIEEPQVQGTQQVVAPVGFLDQVVDQVRQKPILSAGCLVPLILLFCAGIFMVTRIQAMGGLFASDTPTPTLTFTATLTLTPLPTASLPPTDTPTLAPSPTPMPSPTPAPTYTPLPTYTPQPTVASSQSEGKVWLCNKRYADIEVWREGHKLGQIMAGRCMYVNITRWGYHEIKWCSTNGRDCRTKSFDINTPDQTINLN